VKIDQDIADVLRAARFEGNRLVLQGQLDRKLYTRVNDVITALGGEWKSGKVKAHVFAGDARAAAITIRDTLAAGDSLAEEVALAILAYVHGKRAAAVLTRDSLDRIAIELGVAIAAYHHDIADGREDEHHRHAAHLRKIAGIALRGAAACARRGGR
jgi:hypothetical protein